MVGLKHTMAITQEEFDGAVKCNIDELGLEEEEAVQAAKDEFELQGADLSGIVILGVGREPVVDVCARLSAAVVQNNAQAIKEAAEELLTMLGSQKDSDLVKSVTAASKQDVIDWLLQATYATDLDKTTRSLLMACQKSCLVISETRDQFCKLDGPNFVIQYFRDNLGAQDCSEAALGVMLAACTKSEDNKQALMDLDIGQLLADFLEQNQEPSSIKATSRLIVKLTTADDSRPVVSRAFQNSKSLAGQGLHLLFLQILKQSRDTGTTASCCQALKKLCVNDELCKQAVAHQAIEAAVQALEQNAGCASTAKSAFAFLRQLAGNDDVKQRFTNHHWLELSRDVLSAHMEDAGCMEQGLGLLAAITLRSPEIASCCMAANVPEAILEVMRASESQWVQRQACMAVRNLVARNLEHRPALLDLGFESCIRAAKASYPQACADVGSAALRDLGLEDYS